MFEVNAYNIPGTENLSHVYVSKQFDSQRDAAEFAALQPKSWKLRASQGSRADGTTYGIVYVQISLIADGVNGGFNETGTRRLRSILNAFPHKFLRNAGNSATEAQVRKVIGY